MSRRRRQLVDDDVPRLPRGRGISLTRVQLVKIAFTALLLVLVIVLQRPCATAAGKFVQGFDSPDAATGSNAAIPKPDQLDVPGSSGIYVDLKGLTPEQQKAAIEKARNEAAEKAAGAGSAAGSAARAP